MAATTAARDAVTPEEQDISLRLLGREVTLWSLFRVIWGMVVAGLLLVLAQRQLPVGLTPGVMLQGAIAGGLAGMTAIGLVVIYRSNRIINFAQTELGVISAVLAYNLMVVAKVPWIVAITIAVVVAILLAAGMEVTVIRRLDRAPRLIATVATLGLTQTLAFIAIVIAATFDYYHFERIEAAGTRFPTPLGGRAFIVGGISFSYDHVLVLIVLPVILLALGWFFGQSLRGVAIRAAAQNAERAGLLGIRVPRLSTLAWVIAGALSGIAAVLQAPVLGFFSYSAAAVGASLGVFVRALAAAVIGRMENLSVTFAAAVTLGVVEQTVFYNYSKTAPMEVLLLVVVLAALIVQRKKFSRAVWVETSSWQAIRSWRPVPKEIRNHPRVRLLLKVVPVFLLLILATIPPLFDLATVRLFSVICVYGIVGLSLVLLSGWGGQVSLGQWAFAGVGAFFTGRMATSVGLDLVVTVALAGLGGACLALLVGLPALRIRGLFLGATTVIFATTAAGWLFTLDRLQPGGRFPRPTVLGLFRPNSETEFFYVVLVFLILSVLAVSNVKRSPIGRALIATRDNEAAAQAYSIDPSLVKLGAFAVSGFLAAVAGSLYAFLVQSVDVSQFSAINSLFLFSMVVIGGLGSMAGALVGAAYVLGARYYLGEAGGFLATGLGMLLLVLFLPGGLSQLIYAGRDRLLKWVARP